VAASWIFILQLSDSLSFLPKATYFYYKTSDRKNRPCSVSITPEYNVVNHYRYTIYKRNFLSHGIKLLSSLNPSLEGTVDARKWNSGRSHAKSVVLVWNTCGGDSYPGSEVGALTKNWTSIFVIHSVCGLWSPTPWQCSLNSSNDFNWIRNILLKNRDHVFRDILSDRTVLPLHRFSAISELCQF